MLLSIYREKAVLAVTLCNEKDEILGHAAFFDYPNVPSVDQAEWQDWMNEFYDTKKCTPLNSLFMHYFVAKKEYANGCAREIVRTAFNAVPDVHFLFLAVPIGSYPGNLVVSFSLTLFMQGKNFSKQHFQIIFLFFPENRFDMSCKFSPKETICMKCHILFSRKNEKIIISLSSAEFPQRMVRVINL